MRFRKILPSVVDVRFSSRLLRALYRVQSVARLLHQGFLRARVMAEVNVLDLTAGPSPYASSSSSSSESSSVDEADISSSSSDEAPVMDEEEPVVAHRIRSAHEVDMIDCPEPPALDGGVTIGPSGMLQSVVGGLVVVKALAGSVALNIGTVMCFENRDVVGIVEEVLGPTSNPFYSVRKVKGFAANDRLMRDTTLFFVVTTATYAIPSQLWTKGCDASDVFDEEVPEHQLEFSDDEQEKQAKPRSKKKAKQNVLPQQRQPQQQHYQQQQYVQQQQRPGVPQVAFPAAAHMAPAVQMTPEMQAFQLQQWQIYMWQQQQRK